MRNQLHKPDNEGMNSLPLVMQLSLNASRFFHWGDIECKMRQDKLFTSTVEHDTAIIVQKPPVAPMCAVTSPRFPDLTHYKNKKVSRSQDTFFVVENIGFEPMTSSMPWKRSSQLS